ncbi:MAG: S24 family peptidase [Flavobacteriaceae bacterium]
MEVKTAGKLSKSKSKHKAEVSKQTGFPSAATHYAESSIDLNKELVIHQDATFFIRVEGNEMEYFHICHNDVLLVDRSLVPENGNLALVVIDSEFRVIKIEKENSEKPYTLWGIITYIIHKAS